MIADRRELYNDQVYRLNTRIAQVPAILLAGLFGWRPRLFFDAEPRRRDAAARPRRRDRRPARRHDRRASSMPRLRAAPTRLVLARHGETEWSKAGRTPAGPTSR